MGKKAKKQDGNLDGRDPNEGENERPALSAPTVLPTSKKPKAPTKESRGQIGGSDQSPVLGVDAPDEDEVQGDEQLVDDPSGIPSGKPKAAKVSRKERKKEKAALAASATVTTEDDEKAAGSADAGAFKSTPGMYGYASGQPPGPDGTNPQDVIAVTGNLLSPPNSRDLQVEKFTLQAYGRTLIKESDLSLINGRRYGLIAPNGSGKSTLLHAIACGLVPHPDALDWYLLDREFAPTEMTSVEAVLEITEREKNHLMDEMTELLSDPVAHAVRLDYIQNRLGELEESGAERRAKDILKGLSFSEELLKTKTKDLSGGWRMRISLARVLFVKPTLMMLDEPTNHLDLEAVVWLEEYLIHNCAGQTLVMTSHSQDTLNEVCTDIIHLNHQSLDAYNGNYNTFVRVRSDRTALLEKRKMKEEKAMAKLHEDLGKTGSNSQVQAKAKVKAMEKRAEKEKEKNKDLQEELVNDKALVLRFAECGRGLPPPVLKCNDVSFKYSDASPVIFKQLSFGIDLDARIALVGPNGAGKSTLLKLLLGDLEPTQGSINRHHHLRLGRLTQHMHEQLDLSISAVEWLCRQFPDIKPQDMRREIGKFGLTGKSQVVPMRQLSDGQRRRVVFGYLGMRSPHLILMDEPTNALDIETIDALAEAIDAFDGGVIFITHDFRLIDQVAKEIWIVRDGEVIEFEGDIRDYKARLKEQYAKEREDAEREAAKEAAASAVVSSKTTSASAAPKGPSSAKAAKSSKGASKVPAKSMDVPEISTETTAAVEEAAPPAEVPDPKAVVSSQDPASDAPGPELPAEAGNVFEFTGKKRKKKKDKVE
ncbi:P-loop containing nucleoside triphosphate hydrolase protein [Zopfochytrium polystomum]|nr:P-loop containing nucleoside triphosphate hydrolase protein [Zopfochytrium polystomum]